MSAVDLHQHLWPGRSSTGSGAAHARRTSRLAAVHRRRAAVRDPAARSQVGVASSRTTGPGSPLACSACPRRSGSSPCRGSRLARSSTPGTRRARLPEPFTAWASVPTASPTSTVLPLLSGSFVGRAAARADARHPGRMGRRGRGRCAWPSWRTSRVRAPRPTSAGRCAAVVVGPGRRLRAQLQAAWWAWHAFGGRAEFPRLRLCFAAAAGLAPVHHERLTARGGGSAPSTRTCTSTPRATARRGSTRSPGSSASTRSCTAPTGRTPSRRPPPRRRRDRGDPPRQPTPAPVGRRDPIS